MDNSHKITKNISITLVAQIISLSVSFLLSMVVPKFIDEYQYSRWQAYVLYAGYVGILHFGLLDGIVLRYSQYDYEQLDKQRIRSQFTTLLGMLLTASLIVFICTLVFVKGYNQTVFFLVSVSIFTKNIFTYSIYLLQTTNRISKYARVVIIQRITYGLVVCVLLFCHMQDFVFFCLADIIGDFVAIAVCTRYNCGLYFGKLLSWYNNLLETKENISGGILLMLANWSSMLLVGAAKMVVQFHWDELIFGKLSFSFSVSNLFLAFVSAISIVLFPTLKRTNSEELPALYVKIRDMVSPALFIGLLFYFPGSWVLQRWLPRYEVSLRYLGILFPMVVYAAKVSLLTNNYLKAYRMEKQMFIINLISVLLAVVLYIVCAVRLDSLILLTFSVVLVVAFRSMVSEYFVSRIIHVNFWKAHIVEFLITIGFVGCTNLLSRWTGFAAYLLLLLLYLFVWKMSKMERQNNS